MIVRRNKRPSVTKRTAPREECRTLLRRETNAWFKAALAATRLINEQQDRLADIIRTANHRLAAKDPVASIQEAEVLWQLVQVADGKGEPVANATTRANLRQAFVAGAQWAIDDMDEDVMITLGS